MGKAKPLTPQEQKRIKKIKKLVTAFEQDLKCLSCATNFPDVDVEETIYDTYGNVDNIYDQEDMPYQSPIEVEKKYLLHLKGGGYAAIKFSYIEGNVEKPNPKLGG